MSVTQKKRIQMARSHIHRGKVQIKLWHPNGTNELVDYDVPMTIHVKQSVNKKYITGSGFTTTVSKFVDVDGAPLYEIDFKRYMDWQKAIRWFTNANIPIIYTNNYVWEYMYHNDIICSDYLDRFVSLDIEVDPNGMDMKNLTYEQPIIAVSLVGFDGREFVFTVKVNQDLTVDKEEEIKLLEKTHAALRSYWAILGWNIIEFDMKYIKERCARLGVDLEWDTHPVFDLMWKYREFLKRDRKPGEITDNKLGSAAWRMLKETKLDIDVYKMTEHLRDDPDKVKEYVKRDSILVKKLFEVKGIGGLCRIDVALSQQLHTFPLKTHPTYVFELYFELKARERNIRLPYKWEYYQKKVSKKGAGGLVLEPVRGLQKDVWCCDFKSLYPNIIRTHNIGINNAVWSKKRKGKSIINTKGIGFKKDIKSLNADIMEELIVTRYKYRDLLDDPKTNEDDKTWYGTMSDAYKLLLVSANGIFDTEWFKYRNQDVYEATTLTGQWYLEAAQKIAEKLGYTVYYGDSVMPNTPVVIRRNGFIEVIPIEDLHWSKSNTSATREIKKNIEIWTDKSWSKIKYSFRHNVKKIGYRILTDKGYVETTGDHSLIINGKEISPKDLKVGDKIERYRPIIDGDIKVDPELAWTLGFYAAEGTRGVYDYKKYQWRIANQDISLLFRASRALKGIGLKTKVMRAKDNMKYLVPDGSAKDLMAYFGICHSKRNDEKIVPWNILNGNDISKKSFFEGYMAGDEHVSKIGIWSFVSIDYSLLEGLTFILDALGKDYYLDRRKDKENIVRIRIRNTKARKRVPLEIISIEKFDIDGPVYDIETENHHFCGGLGGVLLHNTDSIFLSTPYGNDHKKNVRSIPFVEEKFNDILKKMAVKKFNLDPNNYTIDLRFEKIYSKIYFSEKKNYVGKLLWKEYHWLDPDDEKSVDVVGIVMVKYNTIPIVKEAMVNIFDILLSNIDDEKELKRRFISYLQKLKADFYAGKRDELLVISQRVDRLDGYKSEPAHIRAAKKLDKKGLFKPGMNVEYIKDKTGAIILYGIDNVQVSKRTYDFYWRNQVGKWVDKIAGRDISSYSSLDFGYSKPAQKLI